MLVLALAAVCATLLVTRRADADGFGSAITWNREISRLVFDRCASCHRPGGTSFPLLTYQDAQPRANQMKDAVLARRMPPWGAVKGFGHFRNDQSLTQEQVELMAKWVDGGVRRGNNPQMLPKTPAFGPASRSEVLPDAVRIQGPFTVPHEMVLDGLQPERVPRAASLRITAVLPDGSVEPLVWLLAYDARFSHPFLFRRPLRLPTGTRIEGVSPDAVIALLPAPK